MSLLLMQCFFSCCSSANLELPGCLKAHTLKEKMIHSRLEAIAIKIIRLKAIARRLEAIAVRFLKACFGYWSYKGIARVSWNFADAPD